MKLRLFPVLLCVLGLSAAGAIRAQVKDAVPGQPPKKGLSVEIRDVVRLPDSRPRKAGGEEPRLEEGWARISYVRDSPDGRRFVNDSRGALYLLDRGNQPSLYTNVATAFPLIFLGSLESGFISFEFHPEFAKNGLFYTLHAESGPGNPNNPHFVPPGFTRADVTYQMVVTEWHAATPAAGAFQGTRRELLRTGHVTELHRHPIGHLEFNPTSKPGDRDYGLLYIAGGDYGFSNGGKNGANPAQTQRLDSLATAILRIDPRSPSVSSGTKGLGDYTIPAVNTYAADGDPKTLGEIFAHGFRNAHRLSWDLTDGTMFASDIGMSTIEEINIVREGNNYGWMQREGFWDNGINMPSKKMEEVYPLPADILSGKTKDGFTYPVAIFDHDGARAAITAGFAYGGRIPALRGKFVFGEIVTGRLMAADLAAMKAADDGVPQTVAPVEEVQLYVKDAGGATRNVTLVELITKAMGAKPPRADMHVHRGRDGELFVTSRQDGWIRALVP